VEWFWSVLSQDSAILKLSLHFDFQRADPMSPFPDFEGKVKELSKCFRAISFTSLLLSLVFQNDFSPQQSRSSLISILRRRFQLKHSVIILLDICSTLCNPDTNLRSFLSGHIQLSWQCRIAAPLRRRAVIQSWNTNFLVAILDSRASLCWLSSSCR
jgi:hypothetical protein